MACVQAQTLQIQNDIMRHSGLDGTMGLNLVKQQCG